MGGKLAIIPTSRWLVYHQFPSKLASNVPGDCLVLTKHLRSFIKQLTEQMTRNKPFIYS